MYKILAINLLFVSNVPRRRCNVGGDILGTN